MDKLTNRCGFPRNFLKCQLCGFESEEVHEFSIYLELDETEKPEYGKALVACATRARDYGEPQPCHQLIENHPRGYREVPHWNGGNPGHFKLFCGDCKFREGFTCKHSMAKANGGEGVLIHLFHPLGPNSRICYSDERSQSGNEVWAAVSCEQKETI